MYFVDVRCAIDDPFCWCIFTAWNEHTAQELVGPPLPYHSAYSVVAMLRRI